MCVQILKSKSHIKLILSMIALCTKTSYQIGRTNFGNLERQVTWHNHFAHFHEINGNLAITLKHPMYNNETLLSMLVSETGTNLN